MATKQTAKKPVTNQPPRLAIKSDARQGSRFEKRRRRGAMVTKVLYGVVYTVIVALIVAGCLRATGWQRLPARSETASVSTNAQPLPPPLSQNTLQVQACSDSIASIGSYTYSAKYFFDLKQAGYRLADTLSQQASNGRDFTADDCAKYFAVRATYPANHIILQLFTRDKSGSILPYQYKDLKPETCYFNEDTKRTVCPNAPVYGIFVKD